MSEISRGCPSSGWVLALTSGHPHLLSHWSEEAQAELYGATGDLRVPGRPVQAGLASHGRRLHRQRRLGLRVRLRPLDTLHGQRDRAEHRAAPAHVAAHRPRRLRDRRQLGRDRSAWDGLQARRLRGRLRPRAPVHHRDRHVDERPPGWRTHANPLYAGGLFSLLFFELGAIAVGAARGAIDVYEDVLAQRPSTSRRSSCAARSTSTSTTWVARSAWSTSRRPRCSRDADRYMEQATRAYEADQPVDDNDEETRRLLFLQQNCIRLCDGGGRAALPDGRHEQRPQGPPDRQRDAGAHRHAHPHGPAAGPHATNLGRLRLGMQPGFV